MNCKVGLTYGNEKKVLPYIRALEAAGLEVVTISPEHPRSLEGLSGLVLSGGPDVEPSQYGEPPAPETEPNPLRDELELPLAREALSAGLPLLAICRGMQLLNVVCGGTLIQHLDNASVHRVPEGDPSSPVHTVEIEPGTRLRKILGDGTAAVNSRHHQAVRQPGVGLVVSARAADGTIEAMELPSHGFAVAVQWHPEDQALADPKQRKLFHAFAEACSIGRSDGSAR